MMELNQETLFGKKVISTISFNEQEIIRDILFLHADGKYIDCDPTYSVGNFYKDGLPKPRLKFDLAPQIAGVVQADARNLPLEDLSINILMFDPPFICGIPAEAPTGIIRERFGFYKNVPELWQFYLDAIREFERVIAPKGLLIFKCQDTVDGGKNYFTHCQVLNMAVETGFYPKDLFILAAKNRIVDVPMDSQQHARKFHSYFWVFEKIKSKVNYVK